MIIEDQKQIHPDPTFSKEGEKLLPLQRARHIFPVGGVLLLTLNQIKPIIIDEAIVT